ncbi:MAG: DnaA N-terminal domain-containing protein [Pseudomonadota bacterium]
MQKARAVGRNAAVMKYDLLTALGAYGCSADKHLQRLVLRLITLIVARYNWQTDEIATGQREIAQMWAVDERTVKRDMARLRDMGWLVQKRAAARGRVAVHGLGIAAILGGTQECWDRVGPDFTARMTGPEHAPAAPVSNVVSFPVGGAVAGVSSGPVGQGVWARAQQALHQDNPVLYAAWFAQLTGSADGHGTLHLTAPSRFHATFLATHHLARLEAVVRRLDGSIQAVQVRGP